MGKEIELIESAWANRDLVKNNDVRQAVIDTMEKLDKGTLRVAQPEGDGWKVNEWVKKAILLFFQTQKMETIHAGDLEFYDKIPLKKNFEAIGVRAVPHGLARYASYLAPGV
ncbi:MAG TPA: 2,3,4,5-tetrahydropyridine-2,6-dicarboxylate N-succinyltransferase, partial [Bacteroidia bacterium]|nr:2,3,4,5-tetrahydropyridine-2,6-dicarboxylate N-succinyltransferase [Bacteroidia bacterium]